MVILFFFFKQICLFKWNASLSCNHRGNNIAWFINRQNWSNGIYKYQNKGKRIKWVTRAGHSSGKYKRHFPQYKPASTDSMNSLIISKKKFIKCVQQP